MKWSKRPILRMPCWSEVSWSVRIDIYPILGIDQPVKDSRRYLTTDMDQHVARTKVTPTALCYTNTKERTSALVPHCLQPIVIHGNLPTHGQSRFCVARCGSRANHRQTYVVAFSSSSHSCFFSWSSTYACTALHSQLFAQPHDNTMPT